MRKCVRFPNVLFLARTISITMTSPVWNMRISAQMAATSGKITRIRSGCSIPVLKKAIWIALSATPPADVIDLTLASRTNRMPPASHAIRINAIRSPRIHTMHRSIPMRPRSAFPAMPRSRHSPPCDEAITRSVPLARKPLLALAQHRPVSSATRAKQKHGPQILSAPGILMHPGGSDI